MTKVTTTTDFVTIYVCMYLGTQYGAVKCHIKVLPKRCSEQNLIYEDTMLRLLEISPLAGSRAHVGIPS